MEIGKLKIPFTFLALVVIQLFIFSGVHVASAASDEQEIETLIEDFNVKDVNVKADSVKALVEAGEPAVEPLIQALNSKYPESVKTRLLLLVRSKMKEL